MKTLITPIAILFFILAHTAALAQDVIHKHDGQTINAKNIVIGQADIEYVRYDDASMVVRTIPRAEVLKIKYANGTVKPISQPKKAESVEVDRSSLWGTQTGGTAYKQKDRTKKLRKQAVQRPIVAAGWRWELGYTVELPDAEKIKRTQSLNSYMGVGLDLSIPLKKTMPTDTVQSMWAVFVSYAMTQLHGNRDSWYLPYDQQEAMPDDVWFLSSERLYTTFNHHATLGASYRIRLSRRAFIAPFAGMTLVRSKVILSQSRDRWYWRQTPNGNYYRSSNWSYDDIDYSHTAIGAVFGAEFLIRPFIGFSGRYSTATNSGILGINLVF